MSSSKLNSGGALLEDFASQGSSLIVWELGEGGSKLRHLKLACHYLGEKLNETAFVSVPMHRAFSIRLPSGNTGFILTRSGEHALANVSGDRTSFDDLEIDGRFLGIDSAHAHLTGITAKQELICCIPTRSCGSLMFPPV